MRNHQIIYFLALLLDFPTRGFSFVAQPVSPTSTTVRTRYAESDYSYAAYTENVVTFCYEMGRTSDDYEEMVYKLMHQKEALVKRAEVIEELVEVGLIGTDPVEISRLADTAKRILEVEQLLFVTTQLVDYTSTNSGSAKASPKPVPHPPTVAPDLRLFYEQGNSKSPPNDTDHAKNRNEINAEIYLWKSHMHAWQA